MGEMGPETDDPSFNEKKCRGHTGSEMITNRFLVALFWSMVINPGWWMVGWVSLSWVTGGLATEYSRLQKKPLDLHPFNNKLQDVALALQKDFKAPGVAPAAIAPYEAVVIWCDTGQCSNLQFNSDFHLALGAINYELSLLRGQKKNCKDMVWQSWNPTLPPALAKQFLSDDNSASVISVTSPCQKEMMTSLLSLDQKYGGLRVALGTPAALAMASTDEALKSTSRDMWIAIPVTFVFVWLNTGGFWRATTPYVALLCTAGTVKAAIVVIKLFFWEDLNFSGPDSAVFFVQLALGIDYGLFFWSRFSHERRLNPGPEYFKAAIVKTLQTSGAVIFVSMIVLALAFTGMCFYPDQNLTGGLSISIQMIISVVFLCFFSLLVPATQAAWDPNLYDEHAFVELDFGYRKMQISFVQDVRNMIGNLSKKWLASFSGVITSKPWLFVLPMLIYACFVPCFVELCHFKPNFETYGSAFSNSVNEYNAYNTLKSKFNVGRMDPLYVMMEASPLPMSGVPTLSSEIDSTILFQTALSVHEDHDGALSDRETGGKSKAKLKSQLRSRHAAQVNLMEAQSQARVNKDKVHARRASTAASSAEFGSRACHFIESVISSTRDKPFQINATDIESPWWDSTSGSCRPQHQQFRGLGEDLSSNDGRKQLIKIYPKFRSSGEEAQAMTRFFWEHVEPQSESNFTTGGQLYNFKARHFTGLAEAMLEEELYGAKAPYVISIMILVVCLVVGLLFNSAGLGAKLVFTVVLPILAEFGFIIGAYQDGWLEWAGVERTGGLLWGTAFTGMGLLFGLAIDYDIFLFARVYERRLEGYDNISAVRLALTETSGVITVAGTIMCLSFFFLARSTIYVVSQTGCLYFVGIAVDTYIVRFFLAPAVLCLNETMNYWPGKIPPASKCWDGDLSMLEPSEVKKFQKS